MSSKSESVAFALPFQAVDVVFSDAIAREVMIVESEKLYESYDIYSSRHSRQWCQVRSKSATAKCTRLWPKKESGVLSSTIPVGNEDIS